MSKKNIPDAIILTNRLHTRLQSNFHSPLFICSEMFIDLKNIEQKRWQLWALRNELRKRGHAVAILADFLKAEDIGWLERQGAEVAQKWYLDDKGQDFTLYRGVSLGCCIEYDVKARAIRLLKLARCIERVCKRYPGVRICTDFAPGSLELSLLEGLGIDVCSVDEEPAVEPLPHSSFSKIQVFKFARQVGLISLRLISRLTSRRQSMGSPRVIIRVGLQSSLMLESWLKNPIPGVHFVLWMDYLMRPFSVLRLVLAGHSITASQLPLASSEELSQLHVALKRHLGSHDRHAWAGAPVTLLLDNMLCQQSTKSFPVVRSAVDDAYAELSRTNTALLVIPNDCQLLMRAWTLVSKALGQSSLVIQHGHLDYIEDGDHHTATHSAFWSDIVAQEFRNAGLRTEQLIVSGSPNADGYIKYRNPLPTNHFTPMPPRPRILIITTGNPGVQAYVRETWVCDYVDEILEALKPRFSDFHIAMKLHPGENAVLYREFLADRLPSNVEISDRGNLEELMAEADIIISPPSTVVIEARACGKTVILMTLPTVEGRKTTLTEASGVIVVHRNEDLVPTIDAIVSGASDLSLGKWSLEQFLGPLDGGSSRRLLNDVLALAIESSDIAKMGLNTSLEKSHAVR